MQPAKECENDRFDIPSMSLGVVGQSD